MKNTLLITVVIIVSVVFCSCSGADTPSAETAAPASTSVESTTAAETLPEPKLPDVKYNGEAVNFLVRGEKAQPTNGSHEIYAEEENGEAINDAVFRRNAYVEDKYDVKITETAADDTVEAVRSSVQSADQAFRVVMIRPNRAITAAADGLLCNLFTVPHINLTAPWWDVNAVETLPVCGKLYFVTGDINIMDNNSVWTAMFNKKLYTDYGLAFPYEAVKNGTWTLDRFLTDAKVGGKDLDGDGVMTEKDQYGLIMAKENIYPLIVAGGQRITQTDKNGSPALAPDIETIHTLIDKIIKATSDESLTLFAERYQGKGYANVWSEVMRESFRQGRVLLYVSGSLSSTYLRDMEDEFGILPLPKKDEAQSDYHTWMNNNNSSTFAIPVSNDKLEMTCVISEALAARSMTTLTPAYYEITLSGKVARDADSVEMLTIILNSVVFDLANIYDFGGINGIFSNGSMTGENTFASDWASKVEAANTALASLIEKYKTLP